MNLTNVDFKTSNLNNVVFDRATITNSKLLNTKRVSGERFRGQNLIGVPTSLPKTLGNSHTNKYNYTIVNNKFISIKI